jgi:hypothetical protein
MGLPVAILRGDGLVLDRYAEFLPVPKQPGERLPYVVTEARGHVVSRYPVGAALVALPIYLPLVACLDRFRPEWDRKKNEFVAACFWMSRIASAAITSLAVVFLYRILRRLELGTVALPVALAAAFGSSFWTIASQGLWQHGPAALALTLSIFLLLPTPTSRLRLFLAGGAVAGLVAIRATDIVFAAAIVVYLARYQVRGLLWFAPLPVVIAGLLLTYNIHYFGNISGGQHQIEQLHPVMHNVSGPWTGDLLVGMTGTLASPSRGLFVFSPWIALSLVTLPFIRSTLRSWPLLRYLLWALGPYLALLSKYSVWWAGHGFGPRYWTDAIPLFAIVLGFCLEFVRHRSRAAVLIFGCAIVFSIAVQLLGILRYTGSWDGRPVDIDQHHERLWDWRDSVLVRCLRER